MIDLKGKKYGRLKVLEKVGANKHGSMRWRAECACGRVVVLDGQHLRRGAVISCGCSKLAPRDAHEPPAVRGARWIALGGGGHALVDAADFEWLSQWPWHLHEGYAVRYEKRRMVRMSRAVAERRGLIVQDDPRDVDHARRDKLDNRFAKLRVATRSQNLCNRPAQVNNTVGFKGVTKFRTRFLARITAQRKHHHLGSFATAEEAARAYNAAARRLHGQFARLNEGV